MNTYEMTFIVSPETSQEKIESIGEKVKKIITQKSGQISIFEVEGLKKLAYPIKSCVEGQYVFVEFSAPGSCVTEMEGFFKVNDAVLRYLTIVKPVPRKIKAKKTKKLQSAKM